MTAGGYSPRRGVLCSPSEAPTGAAPVSYPRVPRLKQLAAAAADLDARAALAELLHLGLEVRDGLGVVALGDLAAEVLELAALGLDVERDLHAAVK